MFNDFNYLHFSERVMYFCRTRAGGVKLAELSKQYWL